MAASAREPGHHQAPARPRAQYGRRVHRRALSRATRAPLRGLCGQLPSPSRQVPPYSYPFLFAFRLSAGVFQ